MMVMYSSKEAPAWRLNQTKEAPGWLVISPAGGVSVSWRAGRGQGGGGLHGCAVVVRSPQSTAAGVSVAVFELDILARC
jgi:hypothetical protein